MRALACALALLLGACASAERAPVARAKTGSPTLKAAIEQLVAKYPEDAEILSLVDVAALKQSPDEAAAMARFLHVLAVDRRKLRETAAARAKDERRAQERAAQLQQKLDALTELEKSLSERQTSSR